ncbi:rRNA processing protein Rrp15 [Schizosaccharomyces cryophilus OY26]|uniref:rRNA processing protein Rrp15 n=1 Tax=Schizosaccharomyces cryophilus (strain OY26 / ATCC MYA-4695 / CBS 11777 / NBRC 106824 / NRRL Y48691) TaxID=653667 RepID=S9VU69_SCHCR|nr:rRNA processing protein Rrp15 [Schizosaccharomyces cryophilus OY26]EPY49655.1 rRNA processing protein Rrp15 [Schizosaccharomyces cryophilus OY26]
MAKAGKKENKNTEIEFVPETEQEEKQFVKESANNSDSEEELEDLESEDEFDQLDDSDAENAGNGKALDRGEEKDKTSSMADDIANILNEEPAAPETTETPVLSLSRKSKKAIRKSSAEKKSSKLRTSHRRERLQKENVGRITNIVATDGETVKTYFTHERELRRIARRGVVQLFNAIRTSQMKGAMMGSSVSGGRTTREQKVQELSKSSFLDLIKSQ